MRRLIVLVLLVGASAVSTGAAPASAAAPLDDIPFAVGSDWLFSEVRNDGAQGDEGHWELLEGRLRRDDLRLKLRFEPPRYELPVEPGPAALFGGFHLSGDTGSTGEGEWVDSLTTLVLDPCTEAACVTVAAIDLPIHDLGPAIRRLERRARLTWVSAELTLVRSFAGGTWLQVIPFQHADDGSIGGVTGTVGTIEPTAGRLFRYGLFPAELATPVGRDPRMFPNGFDYRREIEEIRRDAGDQTEPIALAPAELSVAIRPQCEGSPALTLHDEGGDWLFETKLHRVAQIDQSLMMPVDVRWWLTLHDGGGMNIDQRDGWGVRLGPVVARGAPIEIDATLDCSDQSGVLRQNGTVVGGVESSSPRMTPAIVETAMPSAAPSAATTSSQPASAPGWTGSLAVVAIVAAAVISVVFVMVGGAKRRKRD